ncbi:unnamed protein product (macronuclear) [Paramecium tetraurelia]|uniref:Uncharacterized protein n=1 Tax=Paramecium tetraurelia TaxID=5888 RepID=A0BQB1_PARTE|nr:uncharacterized protein GSPATT00030957001 [Paramecium tetraurelia]CAK60728.1 unnamed protein product [Paramecium tetraurelia]|eukprot:XP_001428126.1 hypothetical protein (macronuclear) [Paramecium tetraurelia strain d4-2]
MRMFSYNCIEQIHKNHQIDFYCFNPDCQDRKLFCLECLQSGMHLGHAHKLDDIDRHRIKIYDKCKALIDQLNDYKLHILNFLELLTKTLQQKFQTPPKSNYSFDQLESYINTLLDFETNQSQVENKVIKYLLKSQSNIQDVIIQLEVKERLHYQAPSTSLQRVRDLQRQSTQLFQNNELQKAQDILDQTLDLDPNNPTSLALQGNLLLSKAKYTEAYNIFSKLNKIDPNHIQGLNGLGMHTFISGDSLRAIKNCSVALEEYKKVLALDSLNVQALIGKAYCLGQKQKFQKAQQIYDQILFKEPANVQAIFGQGIFVNKITKAELLRIKEKFDEAITLYDKALSLNKNHIESLSGKGDCYRSLGKFRDAMVCLKKAEELNPLNSQTLIRIGDCLKLEEKLTEAYSYYEKALKINPLDEWSQLKMGKHSSYLKINAKTIFDLYDCEVFHILTILYQ